ncbi:MAG: hypothetical protein U1F11_05455 [Steroidobacteraceae bacterium]
MKTFVTRRSVLAGLALAPLVRTAHARRSGPTEIVLRTADGRNSTVTVWRTARRRRGTLLFSHGAASAPYKYTRLVEPWVAAGYDVHAPLHPDSTDHPDTARFKGFTTWAARIEDMRALAASIPDEHYVATGHSYGAMTALVLGGAEAMQPQGVSGPLRDPRVIASVAFSPPAPIPGFIEARGYATLAVPAFVQSGDRDVMPGIAGADWKGHLTAWEAAAASGDRYALVLAGVDHYFGGLICESDKPGPPQAAQLRSAIALSTLFIEAYGSADGRARRALERRLAPEGKVILRRK